jgi:hypothetical protein
VIFRWLTLLFLLCASPAWASPVPAGTAASNGVDGLSTLGGTHDSGASGSNCLAVIGVVWRDTTDTITSATFNGLTFTLAPSGYFNNGSNMNTAIWYRKLPSRGSFTWAVNLSAPANAAAVIQTFCEVDQTTPFGTVVTSTGGPISDNVTSAAGELVIDVAGQTGTSATLNVGAGQTLIATAVGGSDASARRASMSYEAGANPTNMAWTTDGSETQIHIAVPLMPAAVGGGTDEFFARRRR